MMNPSISSPSTSRLPRTPVRLGALLLTLALTAAACGSSRSADTAADGPGASTAPTTAAMADDEAMSDEAMSDEAMSDEAMSDAAMTDDEHDDTMADDEAMSDEAMADSAVLALSLTDVDGVEFRLTDFAGTPVVVETFATWCPNCRAQLANNQEAAKAAGSAAVFVALSTETDIDPAEVADYADENGFSEIRFAVLSPEGLAAFNDQFGGTAINPPSTPHWVITADGSIGELTTGSESASEILAALGLS